MFLTNNKPTNLTDNDQQPSLEEKLTKEISMLQERILKLENRKSEPKPREMQNSQLKNEMVIVDMQESFEPTENVQQPPLEDYLTKEISMSQERIFKLESGKSAVKGKPKGVQNPQLKKEVIVVDMQES